MLKIGYVYKTKILNAAYKEIGVENLWYKMTTGTVFTVLDRIYPNDTKYDGCEAYKILLGRKIAYIFNEPSVESGLWEEVC